MLEGFHPLKHALRFDANVLEVVTSDAAALERLAAALAPELAPRVRELAREIDPAVFEQLAPLGELYITWTGNTDSVIHITESE